MRLRDAPGAPSVRSARVGVVMVAAALVVATLAVTTGCQRLIFRQYEYEEEVYLKLDGSATVYITASIPALIALRGVDLDPSPSVLPDRETLRAFYASPVARVARVSPPWRRHGRRYVQIRLEVDDVRQLSRAPAFAWSTYQFGAGHIGPGQTGSGQTGSGEFVPADAGPAQAGAARAGSTQAGPTQGGTRPASAPQADVAGQGFRYLQTWGAAAGKPVPGVNWDGSELVAVRMHVPSRIESHNATSRKVDRGNIIGWEQKLTDRLSSQPMTMEVRMQAQSILYRTLTIFGLALAAAVTLMALIVVWVRRKGSPPEARQA